jgi:hypothetical protein
VTRARAAGADRRPGALAAAALCFGLVYANCYILHVPIDGAAITAGGPQVVAAAAPNVRMDALPASAAAFPATLTRPLFRASRRPPDLAKPELAGARPSQLQQPARLPDGVALIGILQENGGAGRALIRSRASTIGQWVEVGHVLEGWRLSRIETGSIQFEAGGAKQSLSLFPRNGE